MLISGSASSQVDPVDWKRNTSYIGDADANNPIVVWFWEYVFELTDKERLQLLKFVTSSSRLPANGFKGILPKFQIELGVTINDNGVALPSSRTWYAKLIFSADSHY